MDQKKRRIQSNSINQFKFHHYTRWVQGIGFNQKLGFKQLNMKIQRLLQLLRVLYFQLISTQNSQIQQGSINLFS
ncbi:hypothetical protein FGO68_gene1451 [Halteria grandinella]|uniref:Uncharacterized protein n=1 Tax=Halteria grandinella TaxID=5974 RepID=A0A8J8NBF2_HALGN|nr:hypothetical protein FGO68_gene1451 [Halteria grandinella]